MVKTKNKSNLQKKIIYSIQGQIILLTLPERRERGGIVSDFSNYTSLIRLKSLTPFRKISSQNLRKKAGCLNHQTALKSGKISH